MIRNPGGGKPTVYTGTAPIVVTGSVISIEKAGPIAAKVTRFTNTLYTPSATRDVFVILSLKNVLNATWAYSLLVLGKNIAQFLMPSLPTEFSLNPSFIVPVNLKWELELEPESPEAGQIQSSYTPIA